MQKHSRKHVNIICRNCTKNSAHFSSQDENFMWFSCDQCGYEWKTATLKRKINIVFSYFSKGILYTAKFLKHSK